MYKDRKPYLQRFLSIIFTIHDFCNTGREFLNERALQSLSLVFFYVQESKLFDIYKSIQNIYDEIYLHYDGPKLPIDLEDKTVRVIKEYYPECEYCDIQSSEELNNKLVNICGCDYVKYIFDSKMDCEYSLKKTNYELFILDEVGVKKFDNKFTLYHSIDNCIYTIHIPILFEEMNIEDIEYMEDNAMNIISNAFGIRYDNFTYQNTNNTDKVVYLSKVKYIYALYDLKRSIEYLPIKECINYNLKYKKDSVKYFYITSDRLRLMYAIIQKCPCIYICDNFHIYNYKSKIPDESNIIKLDIFSEYYIRGCDESIEEEEIKEYIHRIPLSDIFDLNNPKDKFEKFLIRYKTSTGRNYISYFWYVVYRFIFFFAE